MTRGGGRGLHHPDGVLCAEGQCCLCRAAGGGKKGTWNRCRVDEPLSQRFPVCCWQQPLQPLPGEQQLDANRSVRRRESLIRAGQQGSACLLVLRKSVPETERVLRDPWDPASRVPCPPPVANWSKNILVASWTEAGGEDGWFK